MYQVVINTAIVMQKKALAVSSLGFFATFGVMMLLIELSRVLFGYEGIGWSVALVGALGGAVVSFFGMRRDGARTKA